MRRSAWAALPAAVLAVAGCDDTGNVDGTRGRCGSGGQILGECGPVETIEDACWKLVECAVFPADGDEDGDLDWGRCVDRLEDMEQTNRRLAVACIDLASCDQLIVNDSPNNPYEWPDCLDLP